MSAASLSPPTAARLSRLLGTEIAAAASLGGEHGVRHYRLTLTGGRQAFAKIQDQPHDGNEADLATPARQSAAAGATAGGPATDPHGFMAEAASLRWLTKANAVPIPAVLAADETCLVIQWIDSRSATPAAAARFGRDLAGLHDYGAGQFGAPWPGVIAGLPLPNAQSASWPGWYEANRLLPYTRIARDSGSLSAADVRLVESAAARTPELAGPPEPPSRIHGDCWSGNVLWSGAPASQDPRSQDQGSQDAGSQEISGWLIDPAAHGGHRETDLAMLALFGAPYLDRIMAVYQERAPLADGWRTRVPLHQLHPLLVHVCLFGAAYRESALGAARAVLAA